MTLKQLWTARDALNFWKGRILGGILPWNPEQLIKIGETIGQIDVEIGSKPEAANWMKCLCRRPFGGWRW